MKVSHLDERIHVLDSISNVYSVIKDIAESGVQEDAFFVCDIGDVVSKHQEWITKLPRIQPHYAVKCNDSLIILEALASLGTSFDCASKGEIQKVMNLGVNSDRIIFANPAKPSSHIRYAANYGVDLITFDNELELHKVKNLFPTARMVLRIRCDAEVAQCQLGNKFGCDPIKEAPELLKSAHKMGINVVGLSFHVGSGCQEPPVFRRAIAACRDLFDYADQLGFKFNLLDIGGGFPGNRGTSIDKMAEIINSALDDYFPDPSVKIIAEPGRFFVSSAFTLACNVHSIRTVETTDSNYNKPKVHYMYYINDGVYGSFNNILYDHQQVEAQPLKEYSDSKLYSSSIWGPTCDGLDQVISEILLPELKIGDWLVFENMGAYTTAVASPFNGFPVPKVHVVAEEHIWTLLKDQLPLTEEHFVMGSVPSNIKLGLDIAGYETENWTKPTFPISFTIPICGEGNLIQEHTLSIDYVDVGPIMQ